MFMWLGQRRNFEPASGLIMIGRVLHNIVGHYILPRGGHRAEVSYFEAFGLDSLLEGR